MHKWMRGEVPCELWQFDQPDQHFAVHYSVQVEEREWLNGTIQLSAMVGAELARLAAENGKFKAFVKAADAVRKWEDHHLDCSGTMYEGEFGEASDGIAGMNAELEKVYKLARSIRVEFQRKRDLVAYDAARAEVES